MTLFDPFILYTANRADIANRENIRRENIYFEVICKNIKIHPTITFYIETSHLICFANQVTGFYVKSNTGMKLVNSLLTSNLQHRFLYVM